MVVCFECGEKEGLHMHHVIPRSMGGTKTLPLCADCHGKVHSKDMTSIAKLTAIALRDKQSRGEYIGGHEPYGYRLVDGELVEHEGEQRVVEIARKLRDAGLSFRKVAAELHKRGLVARNGRVFHPQQVKLLADRGITQEAA